MRSIKSLYGENLSQMSDKACATAIKNQARKGLKWFVSSEEKAILSILKEAEKHVVYNKSPDIENTPNMKKVERQLKILSDEIAKRTKKTDHIEAINNIRKVFVKMCLLSKVEKRIEIQRFVAFYRLAVECTAAQQHQHAQVAAAKGFQHNTQSVSDVIVPSSAPIKNDAIPKKSIVGPAGSETMLHFFPFWPRKSDASKMIELTHKNHTSP